MMIVLFANHVYCLQRVVMQDNSKSDKYFNEGRETIFLIKNMKSNTETLKY